MALKKVYRVEDPQGRGPYHNYEHYRLKINHTWETGHPGWGRDYITYPGVDKVSGFESMKHLFSWFGGSLNKLLKNSDQRVVVYEVDENSIVKSISGKQIAFRK